MEKYKPGFLGKIIPADNPSKLNKFVTKQFDSFNKMYDTCKDQSDKINDLKSVESNDGESDDTLKVKLSADKSTLDEIAEKNKNDNSVSIQNDVITVSGNK